MKAESLKSLLQSSTRTYFVRSPSNGQESDYVEVKEEGDVVDVSAEKLIESINRYKKELCQAVGKDGEITLFLKAQASAGIILVSAAGEAGVAAKIRCGE